MIRKSFTALCLAALVVFSAARAHAQEASTVSPMYRYVDADLETMQTQILRDVKRLENDRKLIDQQLNQLKNELARIASETARLEKNRSIFNRNAKKVEENQTLLQRLQAQIQEADKRFTATLAALKKQKNILTRIREEVESRRTDDSKRITQNVGLLETPALQDARNLYVRVLTRESTQLSHYQQEFERRVNQLEVAEKLRLLTADIKKRAEATALTLQAIEGELSSRLNDQGFERDAVDERLERNEQISERERNRRERLREERARAGEVDTLLQSFIDKRKDDALSKGPIDDTDRLRLYSLLSLGAFIGVVIALRKTLFGRR